MADYSKVGDGYVIVKKGDTLSEIALYLRKNYSTTAHLKDITYNQLAAINDLPNADLIYPGQKIKLKKDSASGNDTKQMTTVAKLQFGQQADVENTWFATWKWDRHNLTENYEVQWQIYTAEKIWAPGSDSTTKYRYSTYSIPENAKKVRCRVRPIAMENSKTKKPYFDTPSWSSWWEGGIVRTPSTPGAPTISLDELKLTMEISNVDDGATQVQFEVVRDDAGTKVGLKSSGKVKINYTKNDVFYDSASLTCSVAKGGTYKARCRVMNGDDVWSEWSDYSSKLGTGPVTPSGITKCEPSSETSIHIEWASVSNAVSYDIEYATSKGSFDTSSDTTTVSDIKGTTWNLTNIESGQEYFFRVRAKNDKGTSDWSEVSSTKIGSGPAAPTTWSSTSTAIIGEPMTLNWVHNSTDNSSQTYAVLELYFTGNIDLASIQAASLIEPTIGTMSDYSVDSVAKKITYTITNSTNEKDKDKTSSCTLDTSAFKAGLSISWKVKTAGVTNVCGEFSTSRAIVIYDRPTLDFTVLNSEGNVLGIPIYYKVDYSSESPIRTDDILEGVVDGGPIEDVYTITGEQVFVGKDSGGNDIYYCIVETNAITAFPLTISALAGPKEQAPIGYYLTISANHSYETVDSKGNTQVVNQGERVYSRYFDISEKLEVELSAGDVNLENGVNYKIECSVSMDSGLTADSDISFNVEWDGVSYMPSADISLDSETITTSIRPYCAIYEMVNYKVTLSNGVYILTDEAIAGVYGNEVMNAHISTGEQVYWGTTDAGENTYYCTVEKVTHITDVLLSVYRREFDGSFTELARDLDGTKNITIVDPHPALDYARYRIVSISKTTGSVAYYDTPGYPVQEKSVVIQWNEKWVNFDTQGESVDQPPWAGSLLRLPYNVDVSDKSTPDVSLIEYIGRRNPVSYYGTQRGESSTWSMAVDKSDIETLYALRRLATWPGDVYVREPSGSGYWATITVSFSQKHCELTIPVTIEVTRVEGGA